MEVEKGEETGMVTRSTKRMTGVNALLMLLLAIGVVVMLNMLSSRFYSRSDLTEDHLNSLTPGSKAIAQSFDGLVIRIYLSPNLPERIQVRQRTGIEQCTSGSDGRMECFVYPRRIAGQLEDVLSEYASESDDGISIEYVHFDTAESYVEEAQKLGLQMISDNKGEVTDRNTMVFDTYVIGATLQYGTAIERFPLQLSELNPGTWEKSLTRRLIQLRERDKHQDAFTELLEMGKRIQEAVEGCVTSLKAQAPEDSPLFGNLNELAIQALVQSPELRMEQINVIAATFEGVGDSCQGLPVLMKEAEVLAPRHENMQQMVNGGADFIRIINDFHREIGNAPPDDPNIQLQRDMQLLQVPMALTQISEGLKQSKTRLNETPGQRKIGFLCAAGTLCPFAERDPIIKPELTMMLGQKNPFTLRILQGYQQMERNANMMLQQLGDGLFKSSGFTIARVNPGEDIQDDVAALVLIEPTGHFGDATWYEVDQFIMSGRPVVMLVSGWDVSLFNATLKGDDFFTQDTEFDRSVTVLKRGNIRERLKSYGVDVGDLMVLQPTLNDQLEIIKLARNPRGGVGLAADSVDKTPLLPRVTDLSKAPIIGGGLSSVTLPYSVTVQGFAPRLQEVGAEFQPILFASSSARLHDKVPVFPQSARNLVAQLPVVGQPLPLAGYVRGKMQSSFTLGSLPTLVADSVEDQQRKANFRRSGEINLLVIGSALGLEGRSVQDIVGEIDMAALTQNPIQLFPKIKESQMRLLNWRIRLAQLANTRRTTLPLLHNALHWATGNPELAQIADKNIGDRTLDHVSEEDQSFYAWSLIAGLPLMISGLGFLIYFLRRKRLRRIKI